MNHQFQPQQHHEHGHIRLPAHMVTRRRFLRLGSVGLGAALLTACVGSSFDRVTGSSTTSTTLTGTTATQGDLATLAELAGFDAFAASVTVVSDGDVWLVESNGIPAHNMMVGITSWQQQVPTAQPYVGTNAWSFPAVPVIADTPVSGETALYRGAIALAINGVPIFNALNNRGDDAYLAGELDDWGGHAGRADDYHYHIAPLHLQEFVGVDQPIAYALDGYPIYGETEPDGSAVGELDDLNGHAVADGAYHYHGTTTYPYINGGLRGVASVVDDQVEPQPVTRPFRPALEPLAGAAIAVFESPTPGSYRLEYIAGEASGEVAYVVSSSEVAFTFTDLDGTVTTETHARTS